MGATELAFGGLESGLVAGRREQVSAAPYGADHRRSGRIRLDFTPDSHDPQVDGAIEGFAVACIGQFQQPLTRQHTLRVCGEYLEQSEFRCRQWMLIAVVVAQG